MALGMDEPLYVAWDRQMIAGPPPQAAPCAAVAPDRGETPPPATPHGSLLIRWGKHLRGAFDRLIASSSLVPNTPVLDMRAFPWTAALRANWQAIRDEAVAAMRASPGAPPLATISPDHRAIAPTHAWRSLFLWGYGYRIDENLARCPHTARLVERIPGLNSAMFSIIAPGAHIPPHRGVTKGLISCHLGLAVPRDGDVRMRIGDRVVRWANGETLVFDDTYDHEIWNDSAHTRIVLLIQFRRPLRNPGRWIADMLIGILRRSAFVQEARANLRRWHRGECLAER